MVFRFGCYEALYVSAPPSGPSPAPTGAWVKEGYPNLFKWYLYKDLLFELVPMNLQSLASAGPTWVLILTPFFKGLFN